MLEIQNKMTYTLLLASFLVIIFSSVPNSLNPDYVAYSEIYDRLGFNFFSITDGIGFGLLVYLSNKFSISYESFRLIVQYFTLSSLVLTCSQPRNILAHLVAWIVRLRPGMRRAYYSHLLLCLVVLVCTAVLFFLYSTVVLRQGIAMALVMFMQRYLFKQGINSLRRSFICIIFALAAFLIHSSVGLPIIIILLAFGIHFRRNGQAITNWKVIFVAAVSLPVLVLIANSVYRPEMSSSLNVYRAALGLFLCLGVFLLLSLKTATFRRRSRQPIQCQIYFDFTTPTVSNEIDRDGLKLLFIIVCYTSSFTLIQLFTNVVEPLSIFRSGEAFGRIVPALSLLLVPHISSNFRPLALSSSLYVIFAGVFVFNELFLKPLVLF